MAGSRQRRPQKKKKCEVLLEWRLDIFLFHVNFRVRRENKIPGAKTGKRTGSQIGFYQELYDTHSLPFTLIASIVDWQEIGASTRSFFYSCECFLHCHQILTNHGSKKTKNCSLRNYSIETRRVSAVHFSNILEGSANFCSTNGENLCSMSTSWNAAH